MSEHELYTISGDGVYTLSGKGSIELKANQIKVTKGAVCINYGSLVANLKRGGTTPFVPGSDVVCAGEIDIKVSGARIGSMTCVSDGKMSMSF